jgi:glutamyl-tRNA reductase
MALALNTTEKLPLAVVGCDFRLASSRWRSRLVLADEERAALVSDLRRMAAVQGFVDLNTCNRTEWIVTATNPEWAAELLRAQMIEKLSAPGHRIEPAIQVGAQAARYLFAVSLGRRSFVVGERQIATQLFDALERARIRGHSCRLINGLGSVTGRLVRDAQDHGCVGTPCRGVHSLACRHVKRWLAERGRGNVVAVVGMGAIGRRVRSILEQDPDMRVVAVNRTVVADGRDGVEPLDRLAEILETADAAIVCTSAPEPVVREATLASRNPADPILVLDLGIPEQVARLAPLTGGVRAGLDDLGPHDEGTLQQAGCHDDMADRLIGKALEEFVLFAREQQVASVFDDVRRRHDRFVGEQLTDLVTTHLSGLDEPRKAQVLFELRGMVLDYTRDIFGAIKSSIAEGDAS